MFKEVKTRVLLIALMALMMNSCGNNEVVSQKIDQDSIQAEELFSKITSAYETDQNELALSLIDKLDSVYVAQVNVRRKAMPYRPKIMEKIIRKEILSTDSLIAIGVEQKDSINKINKLIIKKEKLERQLQVALNQQLRSE